MVNQIWTYTGAKNTQNATTLPAEKREKKIVVSNSWVNSWKVYPLNTWKGHGKVIILFIQGEWKRLHGVEIKWYFDCAKTDHERKRILEEMPVENVWAGSWEIY